MLSLQQLSVLSPLLIFLSLLFLLVFYLLLWLKRRRASSRHEGGPPTPFNLGEIHGTVWEGRWSQLRLALGQMTHGLRARVRRLHSPMSGRRGEFVERLVALTVRMSGILTRGEFIRSIQALSAVLDARIPYMTGHSERVARLVEAVGRRMALREPEIQDLLMGALLHDVGQVMIPLGIFSKDEKLTVHERRQIESHPLIGEAILKDSSLPPQVPRMILFHHERPDGKGYLHGLAGNDIPLGSSLIHLAEAYVAMTSHRPYRHPLPRESALQEIRKSLGREFHPGLGEVFLGILEERGEEDLDPSRYLEAS